MIDFPRHECSLSLTHNQHKDYYETAEQYLSHWQDNNGPTFSDEEDRARCISENELWELQWYPDTPIGSYHIAGSTLAKVLELAKTV